MASGVHAWRASAVPCWAAALPTPKAAIATSRSPAGNSVLQARYKVRSILLFPLGFRAGRAPARHTLEHDPKAENQFSEKFHAMLKNGPEDRPEPSRSRQNPWGHGRLRAAAFRTLYHRAPSYCRRRGDGRKVLSGIVNTLERSTACAMAFCNMGPTMLRQPINTAATTTSTQKERQHDTELHRLGLKLMAS